MTFPKYIFYAKTAVLFLQAVVNYTVDRNIAAHERNNHFLS